MLLSLLESSEKKLPLLVPSTILVKLQEEIFKDVKKILASSECYSTNIIDTTKYPTGKPETYIDISGNQNHFKNIINQINKNR